MTRAPYTGLAVIALFWAALFYLGYPMPTLDDLYFLGPAFSLAAGGTYTNPYCPSIDVLGARDHFFVYMPLHEFALAGWLKIWGIERASLAAFETLCAVAASWGFFRLVCPSRRHAVFCALVVSYSVALCFCKSGFRPDSLGLALFAGGLQLLRAESLLAWFICGLALGLSIITSPSFGPLSILVVLYCLQRKVGFRLSMDRQYLYRCAMLLAAGAVTALVFLALVDFHPLLFFKIFNESRRQALFVESDVILTDPVSVEKFIIHVGIPLATLILLVLSIKIFPSIYERRPGNLECLFVGLGTVALYGLTRSSGFGPPLLSLASILLALVCVYFLRDHYRTTGMIVWTVLFAFFLIGCGRNLFLNLELPLCPVADVSADIQAQLDEAKPAHIFVDSSSANVFYHYHLPANALSFHYGQEQRWTDVPVPADLPDNSVLVLSTETVEHSFFREMAKEQTHYAFKPMLIVGPLYPAIPANPYDLIFVKVVKP